MPVAMVSSPEYSHPSKGKPSVELDVSSGHAAGIEPLTELRGGNKGALQEDTLGPLTGQLSFDDPHAGTPGAGGHKMGSSKTPWRPPQFQLHLPTPDFGRFLSPQLGTTVSHTYKRIRSRVSPTKRLRRGKVKTPGTGGDPKTPGPREGASEDAAAPVIPSAPLTPAPLRQHKEKALVQWTQEAGVDTVEGLQEILLSEVEDLEHLKDVVENDWDSLMQALAPAGFAAMLRAPSRLTVAELVRVLVD